MSCLRKTIINLIILPGVLSFHANTVSRPAFKKNRITLSQPKTTESFSIHFKKNSKVFFSTESKETTATTLQGDEKNESPEENNIDDIKVGVLFLNLGGPEKPDDVEGFLYNLFADPDIIRLPGPLAKMQPLIARGIAKRRAPKSRAAYDSIGGGSPILKYTYDQAEGVVSVLKEKYNLGNVKTYVGMRYWHPFTEDAFEEIVKDKNDALVIIPLYPQFSISTSGSSLRVLQEELVKNVTGNNLPMVHTVIPSWYQRKGYIQCMANLIQKELDSFTDEELKTGNYTRHVLFSAHGVPKSYIEVGDPYQKQIEDCVQRITSLLPTPQQGVYTHLSYQSRVGPIEWLRPYTDDVIPFLGSSYYQCKNLVVVPISFVSEHIETLEEIDMEYRELAHECGIMNWRRCPALNTDESFINDMADMIYESLYEPIQTVTEACVNNNVANIMDYSASDNLDANAAAAAAEFTSMERLQKENIFTTINVSGNVNNAIDLRTQIAERINGRIAILGVLITILLELVYGKSIFTLFSHTI